jgi:hypothetical protein
VADYEDPGWVRACRKAGPLILIPYAVFLLRRKRNLDGITMLRAVFLHLVVALFGFAIVLYPITRDARQDNGVGWYPYLVAAMGIVALGAANWSRSRPLDTSSPEKLAGTYRGLWFMEVGLVEAVALFGFVGVFITGRYWVYLFGMGISLVGFALIAPTAGDIRRRQEQINAQGSTLSLGAALMAPPPGSPGR